MDLPTPRPQLRRDDEHLENQPRTSEGTIYRGHHAPHPRPTLHRRHREIPLSRRFRWPLYHSDNKRRGGTHRHEMRGNGIHPRQREGNPLRLMPSGMQDELPVLPDGQARVRGKPHGNRHPEPDIRPARMRPTDQHRVHGTGGTDGQPRQRIASHADIDGSLWPGLESETHHSKHRGREEQAETLP